MINKEANKITLKSEVCSDKIMNQSNYQQF